LAGDAAGAFNGKAHLEPITEVVFFFVGDIPVDTLATLAPAVGVKKPTAAAAAQIRQTVRATIHARYATDKAGRAATIPAQQSFFTRHLSLKVLTITIYATTPSL